MDRQHHAPVQMAMLSLWLLLIALLGSHALPDMGLRPFDEQRLALVWLLGALALGVLLFKRHRLRMAPPVLLTAFILIILLGLSSAVRAPIPEYALLELSLLVCLITVVLLLAGSDHEAALIRHRVLPGVALGVLLSMLLALLTLSAAWLQHGGPTWPEPFHNFGNVRFFNQYQTWLLPLLPALLYGHLPFARPGFSAALVFSSFSVLFALLFYSGGRGTLLALMGATVAIVLLFRKEGLKWSALLGIGALAGLALFLLMFPDTATEESVGRVADRGLNDAGRLPLWVASVGLIREYPLLGAGPMGFTSVAVGFGHPHNFPLQFAAEWGLPAALLLFGALGYALFKWLGFAVARVADPTTAPWERYYLMSLTASILAAGSHSLVSGITVMPISQAVMVLIIALALGWYRRHHPVRSRSAILHRVWIGLAIVAAIWLMSFTGLEWTRYEENLQAARDLDVAEQPRFWSFGRVTPQFGGPAR